METGAGSKEEAGDMLFQFLVELKVRSKISARDACILAWWAANAGAEGPVSKLGLPPDLPECGHYSRKFDRRSEDAGDMSFIIIGVEIQRLPTL